MLRTTKTYLKVIKTKYSLKSKEKNEPELGENGSTCLQME